MGHPIVGPRAGQPGVRTADIDPAEGRPRRHQFDPVGHYNRPDVLQLSVDITKRPAVTRPPWEAEQAQPRTAVRGPSAHSNPPRQPPTLSTVRYPSSQCT